MMKIDRVAMTYGLSDEVKQKVYNDAEFQALCREYKDVLWSASSAIERIIAKYSN